jgi:hypothetical protein
MITTSISYGFGNNGLESVNSINFPAQIGVYKFEEWLKIKDDLVKKLKECKVNIRVVHLPVDSLRFTTKEILEIIDLFLIEFACTKYVIHPNKGIEKFVEEQSKKTISSMFELCIENFPYKSKKPLRSPLNIYELCNKFSNVRMTFDTSHADEIWFDYKIFGYFLSKISVIHLSNRRREKRQIHTNFNMDHADLNLVGFVKDLKKRYDWSGDIVLEYMSEYKHHLEKNLQYVNKLVGNV